MGPSACSRSGDEVLNRSANTSASRTAPSNSPSHFSSARVSSVHAGSSNDLKVRRSLRSLRVATRI